MEPGQHVDGLDEGVGINGFEENSSPCSMALSSFDTVLLEEKSISDVLLPIYALAISIGEAPTSSRT